MISSKYDSEIKLSWMLAALAGFLAAIAFTHSEGYFVTFMTGNAGRSVLGWFTGDHWLSITTTALLLSFLSGVVIASICRRKVWPGHPHGALLLTSGSLLASTLLDLAEAGPSLPVPLVPILLVAFGVGALNTTFVRNGEVSIPLSYVTGTLVKLGQGIERHIAGGSIHEWFGNLMLLLSYMFGAALGGCVSLFADGEWMLALATGVCVLATWATHRYVDRRGVWK